MKKLSILFSGVLILSACSSEPKEVLLRTEKGSTDEKKVPVHATAVLTMEVEGMTCEMGCGGSIRKELKATGGVERVKFDFVEGAEKQKTYVYFDEAKVSEKDLKEIIMTMNEKQFTISSSTKGKVDNGTNTSASKSISSDETAVVNMDEDNFQLPNLVGILKDLVLN
jgi:copper chaperone CopZ